MLAALVLTATIVTAPSHQVVTPVHVAAKVTSDLDPHKRHELHLAHLHYLHLLHERQEHRPVRITATASVHVTPSRFAPGVFTCPGLERLWEAAGGRASAAFIAAEIAEAESGGRSWAISPTNDYGLWQINGSHGYLATLDPFGNARAAILISDDGSDWNPWTTYRTGAYRGRC